MLKSLKIEDCNLLFKYMHWRYAIESYHFDEFVWFRSSRNIYLLQKISSEKSLTFPTTRIGLRAFSGKSFPFRATISFVQRFGHLAKKNVINLNKTQFINLLKIGAITHPQTEDIFNGPVMLQVENLSVGPGEFQNGQLKHTISVDRIFQFEKVLIE